MTIAIYITAFLSIGMITWGLTELFFQSRTLISEIEVKLNTVVELPVIGPLIVLFSFFNEVYWLEDTRNEIEQKLIYAGTPGGGMTGAQFLACVELVAILVFVLNFIMVTVSTGITIAGLIFSVVIGGVAIVIGFMWLDSIVADRKLAISRQFPYFLDLAVMSMEAGASFLETVNTYTRDNEGQEMADEFVQMVSEISLGKTIDESLVALESRITAEGVKNAIKALVQGERMGTPLSQVLREQADSIRFIRSQSAERVAEEMKIKMQGPAMLLLISVLLLILGPAVVNVSDSNMF